VILLKNILQDNIQTVHGTRKIYEMPIPLDYLLRPRVKYCGRMVIYHLIFLLVTLNKTIIMSLVKEFNDYRTRMNEVILSKNNLVMKRLWNLDTNTYENGAPDTKTKEMPSLVVRLRRMLRCDDCIKYYLGKCHESGISTGQMYEIFAVANIVGGTIVIPYTRRAAEYWEELGNNE
jgi:alkylhydroperoxidase/carboxymuconolactone decarboxylase family protein YurZ